MPAAPLPQVRAVRPGPAFVRLAAACSALALAATAWCATDSAGERYSATLDALWDYDAPAVSAERFRAEIARHPSGSREALEARTQLARAEGLQRHFDVADHILDEVDPQLAKQPPRLRVRYLLERGRVRNSSGHKEAAVPLFEQALAASRDDALPDAAFYAIDALHMLAIATTGDAALEWNRRAIAAAETAREPRARKWRASLLNNLGWSLHDRGRYAEALAAWREALALREAAGDASSTRFARWTVGRGLRSLGRLDEAEAMQRALATEMERAGNPDGYVYEELAEIALARGDAAAARPLAARAHALLKDDAGLVAAEPERLARLARVAGTAP